MYYTVVCNSHRSMYRVFIFYLHTHSIDLAPLTNLLSICYDLLDELIRNTQLHVSSQGYAQCTKKSPSIGLLKTCYL